MGLEGHYSLKLLPLGKTIKKYRKNGRNQSNRKCVVLHHDNSDPHTSLTTCYTPQEIRSARRLYKKSEVQAYAAVEEILKEVTKAKAFSRGKRAFILGGYRRPLTLVIPGKPPAHLLVGLRRIKCVCNNSYVQRFISTDRVVDHEPASSQITLDANGDFDSILDPGPRPPPSLYRLTLVEIEKATSISGRRCKSVCGAVLPVCSGVGNFEWALLLLFFGALPSAAAFELTT
ncbi:hypothetical protein EVAR_80343_1 [Eumeta japonica]|uniref:Uncharacterized protein n=1 Tax=Eumeta variegata TaxID=151549 RepID=A0A4C1WYZ3_EUMVA|nr:hypothetical protein EVAR_80343_1 [Eumeta japonica]